jgi:predicted acyltransferase (DUF342 family)
MSNPNVFTEDVTFNKRVFVIQNVNVTGDTVMSGGINIVKDSNINGRSFVQGNTFMYRNLTVTGNVQSTNLNVTGLFTANYPGNSIPKNAIIGSNTFDNDVTVGGNLTTGNRITTYDLQVNNNLTTNNNLLVLKDGSLRSRMFVNGAAKFTNDVAIDGKLSVLGDVCMNYLPNTIPRDAIIQGNTFSNDLIANNRMFVTRIAEFNNSIAVKLDASFNKSINVGENVNIANRLNVKDIYISGNLAVNSFANNSIPSSAIQGGALTTNTFANDVSFNKRLFVTGDIIARDDLNVTNDVSFNKTMKVGGAVTLGNTLAVVGATTFANNVTIAGSLNANFANSSIPSSAIQGGILSGNTFANDVSFNKRLFVTGDIIASDDLNVTNDVSFNKTMKVGGAVTLGNTLAVVGATTFANNVTISGSLNANFANSSISSSAIQGGALPANTFVNDISLNKRLFVTGDIIARDDLNVTNDVSFNKTMKVGGAVTLGNTLAVVGATTFANNVTIAGSLNANFANSSIPSSAIQGGILSGNIFANDVSFNKRLFVTGDIIASDDLNVTNDVSFNKTMKVGGAVTLGNTLVVVGATTFANNVTIAGSLNANFANSSIPSSAIQGGILSGNIFANDVSFNKRLFVTGDIIASDDLNVTNDVSFNKTMKVGGAVTLGNTLAVAGISTFANDVSLNQRLFVIGDIIARDDLNVTNDASFNRTMKVGGAVTLGNTLAVVGATTFANNVTISGSLNANFANSSISSSAIQGGALPANTFVNDISLNKRLFVTGDIIARDDLNVTNDVSFNKTMKVGGAVTLGNTLTVAEAATFTNDVTISGSLNANFANSSIPSSAIQGGVLPANTFVNDVSLTKRLFVIGDIIARDDLNVTNDASFNKTMKVGGAVTLGNTLAVAGTSIFANDVSLNQRLYVTNDIITRKNLIVANDAFFNRGTNMSGAVNLENTLDVAGATTFANNVTIAGSLNANFANSSIPLSAIQGGILTTNTLANDVLLSKRLFVNGDIIARDELYVTNDASFNKSINVGGNVNIANRLNVKDISISGNLAFTGFANPSIPSSAIIGGVLSANIFETDVSFAERIFVNNDASFNNKIRVGNDATFNKNIIANADIYTQKRLFVSGLASFNDICANSLKILNDTSFNGNIYIGKDLTVEGRLNVKQYTNSSVINTTTINYATIVTEDLSVNGNLRIESASTLNTLRVNNDATFNSDIIANGDIRAQNRLFVTGNATVGGILTATFADGAIPSAKIAGGVLPANTLNNDVTFSQDIITNGDASFNNKINVGNDAKFNGDIIANRDIRAQNRLFVTGDATVGGILTATFADGAIPSTKIIGGALPANTLNNNVTFSQNIIVNGDASFNKINVVGDSLCNRIIANGDIRAQNRLFVTGDATVGGILTATFADGAIPSTKIIGGALPANTLNNNVTFSQNIIVNGDASFNKINVVGDSLCNRIIANGDIRAQNRLFVTGDATVGGILTATFADGAIPSTKIIGGALPANTLNNDVTFSQDIIVNGDASFNKINVTNDSLFNRVIANGDIRAQKRLFVTGNANVGGNVTVTGFLSANYPENSIPQNAVIGLLSGNQSASNILFDTDINMQKRLFVSSDISSNGVLYVSGSGTSRIQNNLVVNGVFTATTYAENSIPVNAVNGLDSIINGVTGSTPNFNLDVSMNKRLFVVSDVSVGGALLVTGASNLGSTLLVNKATTLGNILTVAGKTILSQDVSMNGNVGILNNLMVTGNITMNGGSLNTTDSNETVRLFETASIIHLGGAASNINIGTGSGTQTTVTIGANNDTVNILGNLNIIGTTTTISATNLDISDNAITLNKGGPVATFIGAGINIQENNDLSAGYIRVDADRERFIVRLPALASGTPQYMVTKNDNNDLTSTIGNITMVAGKYIKQF